MSKLHKYLILTFMLVITVFTSKAQSVDSTTVYESYTFHKDSVLAFDYGSTSTYWAIVPYSTFNPNDIPKDTIQKGDTLNLVKRFNRDVIIDSISMNIIRHSNDLSFEYRVFNVNDGSYYSFASNINNVNKTYSFTNFKTDYIKLSYLAINQISTQLYLLNPTIYYHYTKSNTSFNELSIVNDVKFVNNKFETTSKIDNIKVYDMTGKLIQEGTLDDTYLLEKNTLYFVVFNNKHSKKIFTIN